MRIPAAKKEEQNGDSKQRQSTAHQNAALD
jgi:hypothetical protein